MSYTAEQYANLLKDLLPPGMAFPREPGTDIERFLQGAAVELARVDARADVLAVEVNPATTNELLTDWERSAGLPDRCAGVLEETLQGRRNALLAKLTSIGGQSIDYFVSVARSLGYEITISEFRPFRAGLSAAGDPLTNGRWRFVWRVNAPEESIIYFRAGISAAGEPLASWGNEPLECKLNQLKPAHTRIIFSYGAIEQMNLAAAADRMYFFTNYTLPSLLEVN